MPACTGSGHIDSFAVITVFSGVGTQPSHCSFAIMQLGRKLGYPAQAVGNTGHGVAVLGQPFNKTILLAALAPAATVYPDNQS